MTRRHSVCLSDIPYDYDHDYDYSSYESPDDDANAGPNDTITVYTLRRASSPVMASSYNAGRAVNMNMNMNTTTPAPSMSSTATTILAGDAHGHGHGYGHGHGLPRAGKKPKKKKPKKNKRSKAKDEKEDNSPESVHSAVTVTDIAESSTTTTTVGDNGGQGQPISAPLIVNGANWNWKQKQMSEPTHNSVHDTGDGLQRFLSTHHPPLYMMGPSPGPAASHPMPMPIPGAPFTPSEATTDNTVRAYSIPSNNPLSHRYNYGDAHGHGHGHAHAHMTVCPEHGRALCRVFPGCCVHRAVPGSCAYCPVARSCCCVHHAGDCCYCFGGGDVRDGPGFEGREVQGNGDGNGSEGTDGTATSTNETAHEAVRESIHESESVDETNESVNESEIQVQVVDETETETETVHETVYESLDETVDEVNEKETVDENETINEDNEVNDINETNKTVKETINDASEKETVDEADENKTVNEINETNETVNKTVNEANEANEDGTNGTTNAQTQAQAQLTTHTLSLLETETFSDCRLTLKSTTNNFYPTTFHVHRALLSRSPRIATILHTATYRDGANNEITAAAGDAFSMAQAFETSVQNLYGLPVLDRVGLRRATLAALGYDYREEDWRDGNEAARFPFPVHVAMADFALCYAASGAFFEDEGVAEAGVRLALELVGYGENIEMLLSFALCPRRFLINTCPGNLPSSGPATKKDKKDSDSKNSALLQTQCLDITKTALTHLTAQIPPATPFHFYNSAQPGPSLLADRIPEPLRRYPGSVLSNPKLAEVKFGSFEEMQPNPAVERTSAVLLSLPFEGLRAAFWMLAEKGFLNEGVARAVLVEREARRLYALRVWGKWKAEREREVRELGKKAKRLRRKNGGAAAAAAAAAAAGVGDDEVKVLGYREFFTAKDEQICLEREWVGLDIL